jgi:hypothetical protein
VTEEKLARIVAGLLKEQRAHVMQKMTAGSVADLVRFAARPGITPAGSASNPPRAGWSSTRPTSGRRFPPDHLALQ